jgi:replicative superfamily II helicase
MFAIAGIARIFTQDAKKSFYKYFLHTGFPVESSLHKVVDDHLGAEISAGTITAKQDALDYLTWTFFFRRLHKNPTYYGLNISVEDQDSLTAQELANDFIVDIVEKSVSELVKSGCVRSFSNGDVESTPLGKIASYYYLVSFLSEYKHGVTLMLESPTKPFEIWSKMRSRMLPWRIVWCGCAQLLNMMVGLKDSQRFE